MDEIAMRETWAPTRPHAAPAPTVAPRPPGLGSATLLVALAAVMALLLAGCGGGQGADTPDPVTGGSDGSGTAGTLSAVAPGDLAAWARARLARAELSTSVPPPASAPPPPGAAAVPTSTTRLQEAGIDEPDVLKSDGQLIVTQPLQRSASGLPVPALQLHARAEDGSLADGARWVLPEAELGTGSVTARGLLLAADSRSLVALSERTELATLLPVPSAACAGCAQALMTPPPLPQQNFTELRRFEVDGLSGLAAGASLRIEGALVDARRVGDTLVLVTRHLPALALPAEEAARAAAIARLDDRLLLPRRLLSDGRAEPLLEPGDCWVQNGRSGTSLELTVVTLLDLNSPTLASRSRCFAGGTEAVYLTPRHLWLASTRWSADEGLQTDVHQFAVDGGTAALAYRGSATVAGDLGWVEAHRSYRLSEHEGHLRVLSFTGEVAPGAAPGATLGAAVVSPARLTVLKLREATDAAGRLATVATLPNTRRPAAIGKPGEQLYGVSFDGARGYAVTYRRIDPLYVLDLSDPADPRIAGEVELPGFSEVLQPLPGGLLLGVGQDEADGVAVVLFDVADAAAPRVVDRHTFGGRGAMHGLTESRHAMALRLDGDQGRIALPLRSGWGRGPGFEAGLRGLQTLELDLAARRLQPRALVGAAADADEDWITGLGSDRALLIADDLYHLRAGRLARHAW